ncbi:autophagy-like protein [Wolffia australiana]
MASSEIHDDFIPGKKLLVHAAENGRSFDFDCDQSTTVESLQRSIEKIFGLPVCDQFLLCLDRKLEPHRNLSFYRLPSDDREVFLFNRPRLHPDSPPPPPEKLPSFKSQDPSLNSSVRDDHPLDEAPDPALKALPSYERQFRLHFQRGQAIFSITQSKFEASRRFLMEQWVQQRAMETARGSMDQGYRVVQSQFCEFIKLYSLQHRHHSELLQGFAGTIERLRGCVLHPALQTESRKCLLDFVKEDHLRKVAESCANSHRQFEVKVSQFKSSFGELKRRVEDLGLDRVHASLKDLEAAIKDHQKYLAEQKSIMQSLSKDVNTVKKLVDDCLSRQISSSLRPHDAVSALGPMYDVHEKNNLPQLQACETAIDDLLAVATAKKNETNLFVHGFMQKVVTVQSVIRDIRLQFPAFTEAMDRQSDLFLDLAILRGIAPAYRACLAEVIRRRSSMKLYMGKAGEYAEKLARDREAEVTRRGEFLRTHVRFIPRDALAAMGLFDSPKPCEVNVAPFDTGLLDIDFQELERFAPEQMAGSVSRGSSSSVSERPELDDSVCVSGTSKLEVENAQLRAELASAIARICSLSMMEVGEDESADEEKVSGLLRDAAEKTEKALVLKDEFAEHLRSALRMKEAQCSSYEKRIQELEQRLAESYREARGDSKSESECKSGVSGDGEVNMPEANVGEAMEEAESKVKQSREGGDESMVDFSDPAKNLVDAPMAEHPQPSGDKQPTSGGEDLESELKAAVDQILSLQLDLEASRKLLEESQMNCAHLENCLHKARQEAQTNLCAADRRASEYNSLRSSAIKLRGLFERLRGCVAASGGIAVFVESLRALSLSLASSSKDDEDEGLREFRACIRVLAEKVSFLSRQRSELIDRCSALESTNGKLSKEMAEKKELVKSLYSKLQIEKQGSKEKISFGLLEVHELAAFVLNSGGHYVAINRSHSNYYLSTESVALFVDNLPARPAYITGQIVHIERQVVKPGSGSGQADAMSSDSATMASGSLGSTAPPNPYGLPLGCEYYIVTVAMLPDSVLSQTS